MKYVNINTGDIIDSSIYTQLSSDAKLKYILVRDTSIVNHQVIETRSNNMSVGDGIATAVLVPVAVAGLILDSIFGD